MARANGKGTEDVGGTIPVIGYAPDIDPRTPGVITSCAAFIPSLKGMKAAPAAQNISLPALAAACQGAAVLRKLDDTTRFIAGTGTALYEASASSWTDRTRASGGAYGLGTDVTWTFAQFGDVSIAAAKSDLLQASTSGAFADVAEAPRASIVETFDQYVLLCDVFDQGAQFDSADRPNGWWICARGDYTDWTPSITTQCATGTLTSSPGKIRAARRFGNSVVMYKERSMYVMTYVGGAGIVDIQEIPGNVGAQSQGSVVFVGSPEEPRHIFMGFEDFYSFDGSRPVPIGSPLKETVFGELNKKYSYAIRALHDPINSRIFFYYPTADSPNPDKCVVYNYKTGRWGRDDRTIEAVAEFITTGVTWDDLGTLYATWHDLPNVSWDSSFWTSGFPVPAIFNTSHRIQTLDGTPATSSFTTGDIGSDEFVTYVDEVFPLYLTRPTTGTLTNFYKTYLGDSYTTDASTTMSATHGGTFHFRRTANWHKFTFEYTGAAEIPAVRISAQFAGLR